MSDSQTATVATQVRIGELTEEQVEKIVRMSRGTEPMIYKKVFKVSEITGIKPGPNSHATIMEKVNERRPYCPNDSVPQGFFPDFNKKSR